jgi:uncharacterized OB-fold protein
MEIPRHWRLNAQRYRLEGSSCPICGHHLAVPPGLSCLHRSTGADCWLRSLGITAIDRYFRLRSAHSIFIQ